MVKFLLRVAGTGKEFTSVIPLVHFLLSEFEDVQVNIITDQDYIVPSEWMPKNCYIYNIPDDKKDTVFGVHHFAANLHEVFNINYYIDFVSDFHSAFLGLNFKAKRKIGLAGGPKSYLYNYSMESFSGMFPDVKKLSVLAHIDDVDASGIAYLDAEVKKSYETVLIDLSAIGTPGYREKVIGLADAFEDMKILGYLPSDLEEDFHDVELCKKIEVFAEPREKIISAISRFDIVISDSLLFCQLSLLHGCRTLLIMDKSEHFEVCSKMISSHCVLYYEENDLIRYGIDEERELRVMSELEDYIVNYFNLTLEPS